MPLPEIKVCKCPGSCRSSMVTRRYRSGPKWECLPLPLNSLLYDNECVAENSSVMQTADVVIIGGGIVGSSIAYHLTEQGCRNVIVIERESHQGKGSTGKSMGGVRAQFSTPVNIQMSMYSIPFYASFDERLGHPAGYRAQGYLFLATTDAHLRYLETNRQKQEELGLKTVRKLSADDIRQAYPLLKTDDVLGGNFCSTDGFVDPYSAMTGFMTKASEQGAQLWRGTDVMSIATDCNGV